MFDVIKEIVMYKYVCIGFFLVLFGCQKEDIVEYDLKKRLHTI